MATNFEKLQKLLEELFQLDQADLDFGIYRIMNQKRDEVVKFLEKDLLPQVKEAFSHYQSADKAGLQKELDKLVAQIEAAGMKPDDSPKVQELKTQMADSSVDVVALENEVFSHLFNFFRRYYHEGDFISLRRYKEGVYAIPYEGEEVKLHWANHDQYYIKSSEYFRDYIFTMPSGKRVRVHLVAASSEQDNKKEQAGKERRFIICKEDPIYEENGELFIRFEYRSEDGTKKKQDALNQEAIERVLKSEGFDEWTRELSKPAPTKANPKRTVLEKHLTQYTARNTFDYFIHKDLGGFLRREIDFYIKNEVMHLDDIEHDTVPRVEQYLSKIKVIRKIAHKIIQFLEQLENFQKKLWLKKKFVVETNYCITLDRVPEELYAEIAANDAQREEWVRLFAINDIEKDLNQPGYSEPLTVDFLEAHKGLVIDTAYFDKRFIHRLVSSIDDLSGAIQSVLCHSDNFHALSLIGRRWKEKIRCVFIDPPYNTGQDDFVYKDRYQHSSWASMLADRLTMCRQLMSFDGSFWMTLDDGELPRAQLLLGSVFGEENSVSVVAWQKKVSPSNDARWFSTDHDYILVYGRDKEQWKPERLPLSDAQKGNYTNPDDDERGVWNSVAYTCNKSSVERPNLYYAIIQPNTGEEVWPKKTAVWKYPKEKHLYHEENSLVYWGKDGQSKSPRFKKFLSGARGVVPRSIWLYKDVGHTQEATTELLAMFPEGGFTSPKPTRLIRRILGASGGNDLAVLDFFAGSGTTAQAVLEANRQDQGQRSFALVEMGMYFDAITLPRVKKAIISSEWKDGRPEKWQPTSHGFKYIRLESYEDALNNLEVKRTEQQELQLEKDDDLREQYVLSYMLDVESRGSQSLLNVASFRNPDQYKLKVERNGETQLVNVDLVETFNWLLGLTVKHIDVIRGVRIVEGTNPDSERVVVLWRNLDDIGNDALDAWFKKQDYNTKDQEYDVIYVNGDNNLENLRRGDQTWKVRLIEEEFGRLMFEVEDV